MEISLEDTTIKTSEGLRDGFHFNYMKELSQILSAKKKDNSTKF